MIDFALRPVRNVEGGRWNFAARCVPTNTTRVVSARTGLTVDVAGRGDSFLGGRQGPLFQVPVGKGKTTPPTAPLNGGKGGDPGDDYPANLKDAPQDSEFDPWREYNRECTSFAAWALHSRNGFEMPFYDNAIGWGPDAQERGYAVNSTPGVGSIAWSNHAPYGHVAWVASVGNGTVTIEEYNEYGNGTYDERTVPDSTFTGYIHFKDLSSGGSAPPPPTNGGGGGGSSGSGPYTETAGGVTNTWSNYQNAGGAQGPSIGSGQSVLVTCRVQGFTVGDGNTWWYQIHSGPWSDGFYASADAFYNNGATTGTLHGTPFVATNVALCGSPPPPPPTQTWAETTGGVAHTWTNYQNAGGTEGPSIQANQTVQISCRLQGFTVQDGNTWWYRIASAPWNDQYYVSADAFYNNGQTSGSLAGTPFYDPNVATC